MKSGIKPTAYILLIIIIVFITCKKNEQGSPPQPPAPPSTNKPTANAGIAQTITLPTDTVTLDGSASTGAISSYQWSKVSGPVSFSIQNTTAVKTVVKNLVQGVYLFELKVTDSTGLSSNATVQVTVIQPPPINLQLVPFGTLSQARYSILAATAGNKILFIGGKFFVPNCYYDSTDNAWWNCENNSSRVDIYDTSTLSWSTVELPGSTYTDWNAAVAVGNKIFLTGGYYDSGRVDVYDAISNSWTTIELASSRRPEMAVVSFGNKIFFAGWNNTTGESARVDIYDNSTNSWSTASLSVGRIALAGTSVGNKVLFAGGHGGGGYHATVDIYDASTNTWSVSSLSSGRMRPTAVSLGNKAFFAGGNRGSPNAPVDIYDITTQSWSTSRLSFGEDMNFDAVASQNKILFFRDTDKVDLYDSPTNSWSLANLSQRLIRPAAISVGNHVYIAGSRLESGLQYQTAQVWKLEF